MTVTVRLPLMLEQELADYCVERGITRSEAVKQAISRLVAAERDAPAAYDLGRDLFGPETDRAPKDNVAANSKRLLRERFRA
jgi:Arc/MetJ-type ribon-helix-helix transcriptional regulator